ncbi:MAG: hypothetical protein LBG65_06745 [Puniceicoccales bacterium]|nr:hypothetical protein [Puniceicoccales bacterium]
MPEKGTGRSRDAFWEDTKERKGPGFFSSQAPSCMRQEQAFNLKKSPPRREERGKNKKAVLLKKQEMKQADPPRFPFRLATPDGADSVAIRFHKHPIT